MRPSPRTREQPSRGASTVAAARPLGRDDAGRSPPSPPPDDGAPASPPHLPHGLCVGDECFALGSFMGSYWFKARILGTREKAPQIHVEYLATAEGDTTPLLLPVPRKTYVSLKDVHRELAVETAADDGRAAVGEAKGAPAKESDAPAAKGDLHAAEAMRRELPTAPADDATPAEDVYIDPDLACSACSQPDDEANMLVCDCKRGWHIYCLDPPLDEVPKGVWTCPQCNAADMRDGA